MRCELVLIFVKLRKLPYLSGMPETRTTLDLKLTHEEIIRKKKHHSVTHMPLTHTCTTPIVLTFHVYEVNIIDR